MEIKKKTTVHLAKKKKTNRLEIRGLFAKNRSRWR